MIENSSKEDEIGVLIRQLRDAGFTAERYSSPRSGAGRKSGGPVFVPRYDIRLDGLPYALNRAGQILTDYAKATDATNPREAKAHGPWLTHCREVSGRVNSLRVVASGKQRRDRVGRG